MKISNIVNNILIKEGVNHVFGIPTASASELLHSVNSSNIEYILCKNEATCSFSALKYAKLSGNKKIGVCLLSGSVGIFNAMNGIAEAKVSNTPMLVLSGYVDTHIQDKGAIQELDGGRCIESLVKKNKIIRKEDIPNIKNIIQEGIDLAMEHPKGVVHIGIPRDIQALDISMDTLLPSVSKRVHIGDKFLNELNTSYLEELTPLLKAKETLVVIGGGCRGFEQPLLRFLEKYKLKYITTVGGKGILPTQHTLNIGSYGFSNHPEAEKYVFEGSYSNLLVLGSKMGETSTNRFDSVWDSKNIYQVDVNMENTTNSYSKNKKVLNLELGTFLEYFISAMDTFIKVPHIKTTLDVDKGTFKEFIEEVSFLFPEDTIYLNDIGSTHQYTLPYLKVGQEGDYDVNIDYGCMGTSVGGIGVSCLYPKRNIVIFVGDGSFYMNHLAELQTMKNYNMNITIILLNNSNLHFVEVGYKMLFNEESSYVKGNLNTFKTIASAFNIPYLNVSDTAFKKEVLKELIKKEGVKLIEYTPQDMSSMPLGRLALLQKRGE